VLFFRFGSYSAILIIIEYYILEAPDPCKAGVGAFLLSKTEGGYSMDHYIDLDCIHNDKEGGNSE
jgi:hypothetical protein